MIKSTLPDKPGIPESLKKYSQQFESFSTNFPIVGEDIAIIPTDLVTNSLL